MYSNNYTQATYDTREDIDPLGKENSAPFSRSLNPWHGAARPQKKNKEEGASKMQKRMY